MVLLKYRFIKYKKPAVHNRLTSSTSISVTRSLILSLSQSSWLSYSINSFMLSSKSWKNHTFNITFAFRIPGGILTHRNNLNLAIYETHTRERQPFELDLLLVAYQVATIIWRVLQLKFKRRNHKSQTTVSLFRCWSTCKPSSQVSKGYVS